MSNSDTSSPPRGRFIAVVGPSGVGKDSLMDAMVAARPSNLHRVCRAITRAKDAGGEVFDAVSDIQFATRVASGSFALHWTAHGLSYGIPNDVRDTMEAGHDALANLSRGMLKRANETFDDLIVLSISAAPDALARRLSGRGREGSAEIAKRLARPAPEMPAGLTVFQIDNDGVLEASVQAALSALYPVRA